MAANLSSDSDVFYVEQSSTDRSLPRPNTPIVLHSTEMSGDDTREMPSISSITSPEPEIVIIHDNSNEPTMPYGFGRQLPMVPPSLNDLNLPPNPFNILATMAVVQQTENAHDDNYSPQSPEPSELSSISTPPMNVSAFNSWETSYTTTDDNTFYSSDEPRRIYIFSSSKPCIATVTAPKTKEKIKPGNVLSKRGGSVAARLRSLRSADPLSKGHPRPIKQRLKL